MSNLQVINPYYQFKELQAKIDELTEQLAAANETIAQLKEQLSTEDTSNE